ncbi:GNAT family N-acetyltransferase [bacterium]|nr:MAG: GNAT family N-acetyltransferase [bacterium]
MIRELFEEYERSLGFDLCFQDFSRELAGLPGAYAPPDGWLLLVTSGHAPVGCAGIRKIGHGICELKRMYVRPGFRGLKLGRRLALLLIAEARRIGYQKMRLDTIGTMVEAIGLYRSLGFRTIEPYYNNPVAGALYMELDLSHR